VDLHGQSHQTLYDCSWFWKYYLTKNLKLLSTQGCATKDDYQQALRSYQEYMEEVRNDQRDKAAVFDDG
jgi:hypothetical protein